MNERMLELRQRRGELLARIDVQRGQLAEIASSWEGPLSLADHGVSIVRFLRGHPLLVAGVVAFVVQRRRGVAGLFKRALQVWKGYRYFADLWQTLRPQ
jgi:hypothetical protein